MLRALGLSPVEQVLYAELVTRPTTTRAEIGAIAGDHGWDEQTTTAALTRLLDLELVTGVGGDPEGYTACPPYAALDAMLGDRVQELADTRQRIQRLSARFYGRSGRRSADPSVEVVHGSDAIARWVAYLHDSVRSELVGYDAPPYFGDLAAGNIRRIDDDRPQVRYRILYDSRAITMAGRVRQFSALTADPNEQLRVGDVPMKMFLVDRRVALVPLDHARVHDTLLVVRDPTLLGLLYTLFEEYWNRAVPLHIGQPITPRPVEFPAPTRELLALLAAGYTDRAIADQLGWAHRTVSRRVTGLMRELGVATRFQAGYQAVVRGWIPAQDDAVPSLPPPAGPA